VTLDTAFPSGAITTLTFPNGQTVTANGGATTSVATFTLPAANKFLLGQTHATTPWYVDLDCTVGNGTLTRDGTIEIVAPSGANKYTGLAGQHPYPGDSKLPVETVLNDRFFAEYTVGSGGFTIFGVAAQSVLPATLKVRIWDVSALSWSDEDTYNFAVSDTTPDSFNIPDVTEAGLSIAYVSDAFIPSGFNVPTPISITNGSYSINGGLFVTTNGSINPGDSIRVRATSASTYGTPISSTVTIGGVSSVFMITTLSVSQDVTPFSFAPVTDALLTAPVTSASIMPVGFNTPVSISVVNGLYSINANAFTSAPNFVAPGDLVRVQAVSSNQFGTTVVATLSIGDQTAPFSVTTQAAISLPDPFAFPPKIGIPLDTPSVTSDPIAITGINTSVSTFISGSITAEFSKNDGPWTTVPGTALAGDIFRVRVSSSTEYSTTSSASLTVGGRTATFTVTTLSESQAATGGLKVTLDTVDSGYHTTELLNRNFENLQETINDKILFRDNPSNTPNDMKVSLDMNSNRILNLPDARNSQEPVTLSQALELVGADNFAIYGYANGTAVWVRGPNGAPWDPAETFKDVTVKFVQADVSIAETTIRMILDTNNGNINVTTLSFIGQGTNLSVLRNNTPSPDITVTHTLSGTTIPIVSFSVQGGLQGTPGIDGIDGTPGVDGVTTTQYYIRPINGTAIKNGTGTLTIEARQLTSTQDLALSSGNIKLYVGSTEVTVANGYATGSTGYVGVFDAGDITDSVLVVLKNTSTDTVYDTITLIDIVDGVASNATTASIAPSNGLAWVRAKNSGAWTPAQNYTDLVCTFYQGGAAIATETRRVTLNTTTGALTEALQGSNDANIDVTITGSTTGAISVTFTHTPSGHKVSETVHSAFSGDDGTDGTDGTDGVNATQYYIKPINGTAIKNGVGTVTIEAHKLDGAADALLSSGTIKLYSGATELTVANGFASGSTGYIGVLDSGDINDSIVVTMKDGPSGTVLDSITLIDIIDGIGSNATTGAINASNGLAWVQAANGGAWSPGTVTTDLAVNFYQGGVSIASETQRVTLNTTSGTLTSALFGTNHANISVDVTGSGTAAITVLFTHIPSGASNCS
jgi:hypothetical protein